ncbi:MAG: cytochrome c [Gammaproteobacteria bacterium]|nr:cytochrome c [Gammaproteobacteria bacterium]
MKNVLFLLIGLGFILSSNASFAGDVAAGQAKAVLCASCHGADGKAVMPAYPNLAGQNEAYLVSALTAYRNKDRNGGMAAIMQMQAASLSDDDINNIAAYYASLK